MARFQLNPTLPTVLLAALLAACGGGSSRPAPVTPPAPDPAPRDPATPTPAPLSGRVTWRADGRPAAGAVVSLQLVPLNGREPFATGQTAADGSYRFEQVPQDRRFRVVASLVQGARLALGPELRAGAAALACDLQLEPLAEPSGSLTVPAEAVPPGEPLLLCQNLPEGGGAVVVVQRTAVAGAPLEFQELPAGRYTLTRARPPRIIAHPDNHPIEVPLFLTVRPGERTLYAGFPLAGSPADLRPAPAPGHPAQEAIALSAAVAAPAPAAEAAPGPDPAAATAPGAAPAARLDRALGCLLGLAVGDALGASHEFARLEAPAFPTLATGPLTGITGGGPWRLQAGQVTDDTQMAVTLARSLAAQGRLDPEDLGRRYCAWVGLAFDAGGTTRGALALIQAGTPAAQAGLAFWERGGRSAAGNGSLMRTAPIGVFFAADPAASLAASLADSAITHADPRCQLACAALNAAIGRGLATTGADPGPAMFQAARTGLDQAAALLRERMPDHRPRIDQALADLGTDLDLAAAADPRLCASGPDVLDLTGTQQGFVRVAFRLAFWELRWAPSFQAALVDVANRGGDADTNGAITGALLGARHGAAAIPAAWIQTVEAAPQRIGADYLPGYFRSFLLRVPWRPAADAGDRVP